MNGFEITAGEDALYETMIAVARGDLDKENLASFFRKNTVEVH